MLQVPTLIAGSALWRQMSPPMQRQQRQAQPWWRARACGAAAALKRAGQLADATLAEWCGGRELEVRCMALITISSTLWLLCKWFACQAVL